MLLGVQTPDGKIGIYTRRVRPQGNESLGRFFMETVLKKKYDRRKLRIGDLNDGRRALFLRMPRLPAGFKVKKSTLIVGSAVLATAAIGLYKMGYFNKSKVTDMGQGAPPNLRSASSVKGAASTVLGQKAEILKAQRDSPSQIPDDECTRLRNFQHEVQMHPFTHAVACEKVLEHLRKSKYIVSLVSKSIIQAVRQKVAEGDHKVSGIYEKLTVDDLIYRLFTKRAYKYQKVNNEYVVFDSNGNRITDFSGTLHPDESVLSSLLGLVIPVTFRTGIPKIFGKDVTLIAQSLSPVVTNAPVFTPECDKALVNAEYDNANERRIYLALASTLEFIAEQPEQSYLVILKDDSWSNEDQTNLLRMLESVCDKIQSFGNLRTINIYQVKKILFTNPWLNKHCKFKEVRKPKHGLKEYVFVNSNAITYFGDSPQMTQEWYFEANSSARFNILPKINPDLYKRLFKQRECSIDAPFFEDLRKKSRQVVRTHFTFYTFAEPRINNPFKNKDCEAKQRLIEQINDTRVLVTPRIINIIKSVKTAVESSDHVVSSIYQALGFHQLINRLLTKRPLVYYTKANAFILRDGTNGKGMKTYTDTISLDDYIHPEEASISSLLGMIIPTSTINLGNQANYGMASLSDKKIDQVTLLAQVGARLESETEGDWGLMHDDAKDVFAATLFDGLQKLAMFADDGKIENLNSQIYKTRMYLIFEASLWTVIKSGEDSRLIVKGLGNGSWAGVYKDHLTLGTPGLITKLLAETFNRVLHDNKDYLNNIKEIELNFIKMSFPEEITRNIKIVQTQEAPFRARDRGLKTFMIFAWNGMSFLGNEFYDGNFAATDDPVMMCATTAIFTTHPNINPEAYNRQAPVSIP